MRQCETCSIFSKKLNRCRIPPQRRTKDKKGKCNQYKRYSDELLVKYKGQNMLSKKIEKASKCILCPFRRDDGFCQLHQRFAYVVNISCLGTKDLLTLQNITL